MFMSFDAQCMPKNIKNTYKILSDDFKYFSLAHGAIAWETGVIRRLYDFGQIFHQYKETIEEGLNRTRIKGYLNPEKTHKTVQLTHALFYRVPGSASDVDFGGTKQLLIENTHDIAKKMAQISGLVTIIQQQDNSVKNILNDTRESINNKLAELNNKLPTNFDELSKKR